MELRYLGGEHNERGHVQDVKVAKTRKSLIQCSRAMIKNNQGMDSYITISSKSAKFRTDVQNGCMDDFLQPPKIWSG